MYTISFLESALEHGYRVLKSEKGLDYDVKQRIAFDLLALIGNSKSILVQSISKRENPTGDEPRGAKRVRTLGGLQTRFIKSLLSDKVVRSAFTLYIETKAPEGQRKDGDELRLVMEFLMTYRDSLLMRKDGGKWSGTKIKGVEMGQSPDFEELFNFENSLVASLESATSNLESKDPEYNVFFEILAAIGSFSPQTLERIGYGVNDLRSLKNTRKVSKEQQAAIEKIQALKLDPQEEAYLIYTATGKTVFGGDYADNFDPAIVEILKKVSNQNQ